MTRVARQMRRARRRAARRGRRAERRWKWLDERWGERANLETDLVYGWLLADLPRARRVRAIIEENLERFMNDDVASVYDVAEALSELVKTTPEVDGVLKRDQTLAAQILGSELGFSQPRDAWLFAKKEGGVKWVLIAERFLVTEHLAKQARSGEIPHPPAERLAAVLYALGDEPFGEQGGK